MRFSYAESMTDPANYLPLARAVEEAGYSSFIIPDSICYPEVSDSTYPYTPDGSREFLEDKPFLEPFSLIPAMGAVTSTLRFTTFVVKLPIRHPVLVAKQAGSVAVLTGNRFGFGVGTSPWPEDYDVCDVAWARRGKRMDEMIDIIRGLTSPGYFSYDGEIFQLQSVKMSPTPTEPIPILLGGHTEPALKRAATRWATAGCTPAATPTSSPAASTASPSCAGSTVATTCPSRSTSSASTPGASTGSSASRTSASPTPSSASATPTSPVPTPSPSRRRSTR